MFPRFFKWLKSSQAKSVDKNSSIKPPAISTSGLPTGVTIDSGFNCKITDAGAYFGNFDEFESERTQVSQEEFEK